jgi:hypothetical protein
VEITAMINENVSYFKEIVEITAMINENVNYFQGNCADVWGGGGELTRS